jgi:hypothetical protein
MGFDKGLSTALGMCVGGNFGDFSATAAGLFIVCGVENCSFFSPKDDVVKISFKSCERTPEHR